jgi:uncharacterized protein (TIGR03084 family)
VKDICNDLLAEYTELYNIVNDWDDERWQTITPLKNWTVYDQVAHLAFFDERAFDAVNEPDRFKREAATTAVQFGKKPMPEIVNSLMGMMQPADLAAFWKQRFTALVQSLAKLSPKDRLPWYGPDMSARSFATARLMECWAHGQSIRDSVKMKRECTDGIRHIAQLGVVTFGWTFNNRNLPVPETVPFVKLTAPSGAVWTWNDPESPDSITGSAEDFCMVVTQVRHVADTELEVSGEAATAWMELAQCFAGPPEPGPEPGERKIIYN